jgi:cell division protease FtsH
MGFEGNPQGQDKKPQATRGNRFALIFFMIVVAGMGVLLFLNGRESVSVISYTEFKDMVAKGNVDSVRIIEQTDIQGTTKKDAKGASTQFQTVIPYADTTLMPALEAQAVKVRGGKANITGYLILQSLPWLLGIVFLFIMFRQMQGAGNKTFAFGKSKAKLYQDQKKFTFEDVAGQKEAKYELQEVVDFLKNPQKFVKMGARIPKGMLLVGMPGTGKTLLAKAIAGEAGVPFFHMSGSDFVEMFVGVGASRVRDLFEQGKKNAPCILFIDELDAVGRTRGAGYGGGHDEREQTLNQMLVEMDGFDTKDGVIILAATNRPDVLDPALLRPGRFDRQVVVAMPDINEREAILAIHSRKIPISEDVDLKRIARGTPGTSGADLANLVNEAALFAARKTKPTVDMADFEEARDKIQMGVARKSLAMSDEDRRATAVHEAGHALLHYHVDHADPLHKVTIVPHGQALGLALSLPEKDAYSFAKSGIEDRIVIFYGGFAAETIVYGESTTGVKKDLEMATQMAHRMVCEWGMSGEVGPITYGQEEEPIFLAREISRHKDYSEAMAKKIDDSIKSILEKSLKRAMDILTKHKVDLMKVVEELVKKETLADDEVRVLLGLPPASKPLEITG